MAHLDALQTERNELTGELESLNTRARELTATLSLEPTEEGAVVTASAVEALDIEVGELTERRNEISKPGGALELVDARIAKLVELATDVEVRSQNAPHFPESRAATHAPSGPMRAEEAMAAFMAAGEANPWDAMQDQYSVMRPNGTSGAGMHITNNGLYVSENVLDLTDITMPDAFISGIQVAAASGYLIDLVPFRQIMPASQWNEPSYTNSPGSFWRVKNASPQNFDPVANTRTFAPTEFAVETVVNIADANKNPNIVALAEQELMKGFRAKMSTAFGYVDHVTNVRTAIGNAGLTGNGLIETDFSGPAALNDAAVDALYTSIRTSFVTLQGQYPGVKTCAIDRELFEEMQERRSGNGNILNYPGLTAGDTFGLGGVTSRGINYVPIDVGFATSANNAIGWVMTDWAANTELVTTGVALSRLDEIDRRQGNYVYLLDGEATFRTISRFGVARGRRDVI